LSLESADRAGAGDKADTEEAQRGVQSLPRRRLGAKVALAAVKETERSLTRRVSSGERPTTILCKSDPHGPACARWAVANQHRSSPGQRSGRPCCTDRSLGGEDWTVYQGPVPDPGSNETILGPPAAIADNRSPGVPAVRRNSFTGAIPNRGFPHFTDTTIRALAPHPRHRTRSRLGGVRS
jgi:hypothetical protein